MMLTFAMQGGAKGESAYMKQIMDMAIGAMQRVGDFAQLMKPEEKKDWVDKIFDLVEKGMPQIMQLAQMTKQAREDNMMFKMAQGSPPIQVLKQNVDMQIEVTQKLDKEYGFQTASEILKAMGFERHASTMGNMATYPSKGYGPDGVKIEEAPIT